MCECLGRDSAYWVTVFRIHPSAQTHSATGVGNRLEQKLSYALTQSRPANVREPGKSVDRIWSVAVIDHERPALDQRVRHKPPIPAVEGVVPIVAEHEILL